MTSRYFDLEQGTSKFRPSLKLRPPTKGGLVSCPMLSVSRLKRLVCAFNEYTPLN